MDVRRGHIADVASSPIRCVELVELVTDWMEGGLPEQVRTEIEEHLLICEHCAEHMAQINAAIAVLQAAGAGPTPVVRRDELLAAFHDNCRDASPGRSRGVGGSEGAGVDAEPLPARARSVGKGGRGAAAAPPHG